MKKSKPPSRQTPPPDPRRLRARIRRLERLCAEQNLRHVHNVHSRTNVLLSAGMCQVFFDDDLRLTAGKNTEFILGEIKPGMSAESLIPSADGAAYFAGLRHLRHELTLLSRRTINRPAWKPAWPLKQHSAGLGNWVPLPEDGWKTTRREAATLPSGLSLEHLLISPDNIIPPDHDFRVEYFARTEGDMSDLSLVIGSASRPGLTTVNSFCRPDRSGYVFAFGGIGNVVTELQRHDECVWFNRDVRVRRHKTYRCLAERIGGRIRFVVNGREALSGVDFFPIMDRASGHVGLYSYGTGHRFWNPRVWIRPTCIPRSLRQLMSQLDGRVIQNPHGPARYVEVRYLRPGAFIFKDVTRVVEQREALEAQRRHNEKMEALLHLANAAAHEMNQPLTLMLGYLELILQHARRKSAVPVKRVELDTLKDATTRMAGIVSKMTRIEQFKLKPYLGDTPIMDLDASSNKQPRRRTRQPARGRKD